MAEARVFPSHWLLSPSLQQLYSILLTLSYLSSPCVAVICTLQSLPMLADGSGLLVLYSLYESTKLVNRVLFWRIKRAGERVAERVRGGALGNNCSRIRGRFLILINLAPFSGQLVPAAARVFSVSNAHYFRSFAALHYRRHVARRGE